jgi:hypothetical protein
MELFPQQNQHEARTEKELADLRALSDILNLPILREEKFNGVISIVVDNGKGEEVHVGFPDGTHMSGKKVSPAATGTIFAPQVKMGMSGHGVWRRTIEI